MGKRTIRSWWIGGFVIELIGLGGSLVVRFATRPGNFLHGHLGASVATLVICGVIALVGVIAQVVAWIKALANTRRLADTTWHDRLFRWGIVGGLTTPLLGLGAFICYGVMIAYLENGPDGTAVPEEEGSTAVRCRGRSRRPADSVGTARRHRGIPAPTGPVRLAAGIGFVPLRVD